jgi:hypothetical protein
MRSQRLARPYGVQDMFVHISQVEPSLTWVTATEA